MLNIFIDTNVLLNFYRFTKSDLEELRKIAKLSKANKIRLFISEYLRDEFCRNRELEIARSVAAFKANQIGWTVPNIFKAYPEYAEIKKLKKELEKKQRALLEAALADIHKTSLIADSVIEELFNSTEIMPVSQDILKSAFDRSQYSIPPGKPGSCGDAIHWEWLLATVPRKEDLIIISADEDFESPLNRGTLTKYLSDEWKTKKASKCILYSTLAAGLKDCLPNIRVSAEIKTTPAASIKIPPNLLSSMQQAFNRIQIEALSPVWKEFIEAYENSRMNQLANIMLSDPVKKLFEAYKDSQINQVAKALQNSRFLNKIEDADKSKK
jgi:predicted nucleic acid-binding protein